MAADIDRRVSSLLGQMTIEETVDLLGGTNGLFIRAIPRLGLPALPVAGQAPSVIR